MATLWTKVMVGVATTILIVQCVYVLQPTSGLHRIRMDGQSNVRVSKPHFPQRDEDLPQKGDPDHVLAKRVSDYCRHYTNVRNGRLPHEILQVMMLFRQNITYIDIGAHRGRTSLPVVFCMHAQHRVIAVEPVRSNVDTIQREKVLLDGDMVGEDRFKIHNLALSDESAERQIFFPGHRPDNAALAQAASTVVFKTGMQKQAVRLDTGDALLRRENAHPRVIKIDVQGSEFLVLKGLDRYLNSRSNLLVLAEQDARLMLRSGFAPEAVYDYMNSIGFKAFCKPAVVLRNGDPFIGNEPFTREQVSRVPCSDIMYWKPGSDAAKSDP